MNGLIPLNDIDPKAREIAVAWVEGYERMGFDIEQKHKLASDIMNYSQERLLERTEQYRKQITELLTTVDRLTEELRAVKKGV